MEVSNDQQMSGVEEETGLEQEEKDAKEEARKKAIAASLRKSK